MSLRIQRTGLIAGRGAGATPLDYRLGFTSRANTTGDFVTVPDHEDFSQTTTLSCCYKLKVPAHAGLVYSLRGILSQWDWSTSGSARWVHALGFTDANHTISVFIGNGSNNTTAASATGPNNCLLRGTEYEVAVVFNGGGADNAARLKIFIRTIGGTWAEQALTFSGTVPATLPDTSASLDFGRWKNYPSGQHLLGHLWDIRWFATNVIPSGTDDVPLTACVERWRFQESAGTTTTGEMAGHVGTLSNTSGGALRPGWILDGWHGGGSGSGPKILCLGDSKTDGSVYDGSFRAEMRNRLVGKHRKLIDFVGSQTDSAARVEFLDNQHGGVAGQWLDHGSNPDILSRASEVTTYAPNLVILQGGTNDIANGTSAADTLARLGAVVDAIRVLNSTVPIVVMVDPILSTTYSAAHDTYRADTPAAMMARADPNLYTFSPSLTTGDLGDGTIGTSAIHLSQVGYEKVAEQLSDFLVIEGLL